ncbi:MAG: hypothetical protein SNJ83_10830 [Aggregatilineales bacterium]
MSPPTHLEQEHRRAMARRILAVDVTNHAIRSALRALLTPQHLALAAREGILVVSYESMASQVRLLVEALQQQGFDAHQDVVSSRPYLHTNLSYVGVVVLVCTRGASEAALHQCYDKAMALGKVVIPIVRCGDTLPSLLFDIQPLCVEDDLADIAKPLIAMLGAAAA